MCQRLCRSMLTTVLIDQDAHRCVSLDRFSSCGRSTWKKYVFGKPLKIKLPSSVLPFDLEDNFSAVAFLLRPLLVPCSGTEDSVVPLEARKSPPKFAMRSIELYFPFTFRSFVWSCPCYINFHVNYLSPTSLPAWNFPNQKKKQRNNLSFRNEVRWASGTAKRECRPLLGSSISKMICEFSPGVSGT